VAVAGAEIGVGATGATGVVVGAVAAVADGADGADVAGIVGGRTTSLDPHFLQNLAPSGFPNPQFVQNMNSSSNQFHAIQQRHSANPAPVLIPQNYAALVLYARLLISPAHINNTFTIGTKL
jgi:hypothetical protein